MAQYDLNLNDYIRIIRKRKTIIIAVTAASLVFSFFFTSREPKIYQAKATIKIEERKTIAGLLTEWIAYSPGDVMASSSKLISGYSVLKNAALRLGMIDKTTPISQIHDVVIRLQGQVSAQPIKETNIIEIVTVNNDPKQAMDLANAVSEAFIEENLLEKSKQARTTRKFIQNQLAFIENRLKASEERMHFLLGKVGDIRISPELQSKLVNLQLELYELRHKYTSKHPAIKRIKDQVRQIEGQFKVFSKEELEYSRLTREVEANKKLYVMLKEKLEEARINEAQKVNDVTFVEPAALPRLPINPEQKLRFMLGGVLGLFLGMVLAFLRENVDTSIGTIDDVESVLKLPVLGIISSVRPHSKKNKKTRLISYLRSWLNLQEMESGEENYVRLIVHHEPESVIAESYRSIRTNLKLHPGLKTILITSAGPREGKTTVLTNIGLTIAQLGVKTLLVSSDLRRPAVSKSFGMREDNGFTEVATKVIPLDKAIRSISDIMLGEMKLEEIIKTPGIDNIYILPSGRPPLNAAEILDSSNFDVLLAQLKDRFDLIIFDSPPVLPLTDASLIAAKMDCVVMVYEIGRTSKDALLRTKLQLESTGAKVVGVVMNHIKPQMEAVLNYPYYYRYKYRYYSRNPEEPKKETAGKSDDT